MELCRAASENTVMNDQMLNQLGYERCSMGIKQILDKLSVQSKKKDAPQVKPGNTAVSLECSTNVFNPSDGSQEIRSLASFKRCFHSTSASPNGVQDEPLYDNSPRDDSFYSGFYAASGFGRQQNLVGPSRQSITLGGPRAPLLYTASSGGVSQTSTFNGASAVQMSSSAKRQ